MAVAIADRINGRDSRQVPEVTGQERKRARRGDREHAGTEGDDQVHRLNPPPSYPAIYRSPVKVIGLVLAALLGAVLLVSLGWGLTRATQKADPTLVGSPAPALAIRSLDGKTIRLADLRGTPLVVNFWASWCVPCRQEAPVLNAAANKYARRVEFLGVDIQDSDAAARSYQAEVQSPYPVGPAIEGRYQDWGVTAPPETFFIDRDGVVNSRVIGPLTEHALEVYLSQLAP